MDGEEKHILRYIRTSYIPTSNSNSDYEKHEPHKRKTREINPRDAPIFNVRDFILSAPDADLKF